MFDRPALDDQTIVDCLRGGYGLEVQGLEFVPLGNDPAAWTYHATTIDRGTLFVKVRRGLRPAGILVPRFLRDMGMTEVVAAQPTLRGEPWMEVGAWSVLVYPLVVSPTAMRAGMDLGGWRRLGAFAARLHATVLRDELKALVPLEDFRPRGNDLARRVSGAVAMHPRGAIRDDELADRLVQAWTGHRLEIDWLVHHSDALAQRIRDRIASGRAPRAVLCHADLHAANVLVGPNGRISVVDWDEVIFAPIERDLMFVRGSPIAGRVSNREATAFESGYGSTAVDPLLIAWYRIDWAVQDLSDFARRVILDPDLGTATREAAVALFESIFEPDGQFETAILAHRRAAAEIDRP